jgi:hypothetical protein
VWQRTFVIIHLREIAHIEKPAARFAFELVLGFAQRRAIGLLADHGATGEWFTVFHDAALTARRV